MKIKKTLGLLLTLLCLFGCTVQNSSLTSGGPTSLTSTSSSESVTSVPTSVVTSAPTSVVTSTPTSTAKPAPTSWTVSEMVKFMENLNGHTIPFYYIEGYTVYDEYFEEMGCIIVEAPNGTNEHIAAYEALLIEEGFVCVQAVGAVEDDPTWGVYNEVYGDESFIQIHFYLAEGYFYIEVYFVEAPTPAPAEVKRSFIRTQFMAVVNQLLTTPLTIEQIDTSCWYEDPDEGSLYYGIALNFGTNYTAQELATYFANYYLPKTTQKIKLEEFDGDYYVLGVDSGCIDVYCYTQIYENNLWFGITMAPLADVPFVDDVATSTLS